MNNLLGELFYYLSERERAAKGRHLEQKFHQFEEYERNHLRWDEEVSCRVAGILEGDELLYYRDWTQARDEAEKNLYRASREEWLNTTEIPKTIVVVSPGYFGGEDFAVIALEDESNNIANTEDEIKGWWQILADQQVDQTNSMEVTGSSREPDFTHEYTSRGKTLRSPNQHTEIRKRYHLLERLRNKIFQEMHRIKRHIQDKNKYRTAPLPIEYPDYKKLEFLNAQLLKAEKQLLKLKLRLFSPETRALVDTILDPDLVMGDDLMTLKLEQIALRGRAMEGIQGHPDPHHSLLQTHGKKPRGYQRNNTYAIRQALNDDISYGDEGYGDRQ